MTLWLAMQQREVIIDGIIEALAQDENKYYWETMSRERQLRFSTYSPVSTQPIGSLDELEMAYLTLSTKFTSTIPMSEFYCGFRLVPKYFYFYTLHADKFSEVIQYFLEQNAWHRQLLSP